MTYRGNTAADVISVHISSRDIDRMSIEYDLRHDSKKQFAHSRISPQFFRSPCDNEQDKCGIGYCSDGTDDVVIILENIHY